LVLALFRLDCYLLDGHHLIDALGGTQEDFCVPSFAERPLG
jgi:hypothetical protein